MRSKNSSLNILIIIIVSLSCFAGIEVVREEKLLKEASYPVHEMFPMPESIIPKVEFWEKIFSRYNSNQVLIHDAWKLDRIYEIVDFYKLLPNKKITNYIKWRTVSELKDYYIEQLNFLHQYPTGYPSGNLSPFQQRLVKLLENEKERDKYLVAAQNVRIQFGLSDRFKRGIETLGKYRPYMAEIFKKYNLPLELLSIPLYESSLVLRALSFVNAAGIWQLMPYTASKYIEVNQYVDERYDPLIATEAAARLIQYNYQLTKSWPLTITAYNHGVYGMLRARNMLGTDDIGIIIYNYESPSFKFASRNFYPEFLAALFCLQNMYDLYNNIEFDPPWRFITITLNRSYYISEISRIAGVPVEVIHDYNPSFRSPILYDNIPLRKGYELRLPPSAVEQVKKAGM